MIMQQQRRTALVQQFLQRTRQRRKSPPVSEQEMREHFEAARAQFPQRPPTVSFQQVVVLTTPTDSAVAKAKERADSIFAMVQRKEDFAELARRYGEDGTKEKGGDLGWFSRGDMIRDFSNIAFAMAPGTVSPPVRTSYGWHLIKVERQRGSEIQARHILIRPAVTADDALRARARADTVAEKLRAGVSADTLARLYGDRDEQVRIPPTEVTNIQQRYGVDLSTAANGSVVGPVPQGGDQVAEKFVVIRVLEREEARPWSLEDTELRERIRSDIEYQKLVAELVAELKRSTLVEIRGT
jgi:parvulin-like peptidyl-prolyl isomerase